MDFLNRKQAAKFLGVSLSTLDTLRYEHKISYYQKHPGCKVQFSKAQLEKYLDRVEREVREARKRK